MLSDFRVPTLPLSVELRCTDGRRFAGKVYLPSQSMHQHGPMRVHQWANSPQQFVPFNAHEDRCRTLINKDQLAVLTVPADANTDDDEGLGYPVYHVVMELGSLRVEGQLVVDLPPAQQRVVDLLNGPVRFVTIRDGDRHHLVNTTHVTRVVEVPES